MVKIALIIGGTTLFMALLAVAVQVRTGPVSPADVQPLTEKTASASVILRPDDENATMAQLKKRLKEVLLAEPRTRELGDAETSGDRYFVTRSRLWGFPDITLVREGRDAEGAYIALFARQVYGSYDWNANAGRLQRWRAAVEQNEPS